MMPAVEIGRICLKTLVREAGKKCVIIDIIDKNYVLITGPKSITGVKRRRVNVNHIKPLEDNIKIKRGANDEEIIQVFEESKKTE
jgi:large subunit ribosomal protein L14e